MSLKQKIPAILSFVRENQKKISDNTTIFNILEGDVLSQVFKKLDEQLSGESAKISKQRVPPINILRKVVDKLSSLYSTEPVREVTGESNKELLGEYVKSLSADDKFNSVNESFNGYKYGAKEIYYCEKDRALKTRVLSNTMFLPYGDDPNDPTKMTVMIKFMGSRTVKKSNKDEVFNIDASGGERSNQVLNVNVYHLISDDEFLAVGDNGKIMQSDMLSNEDGVNPYGVIPFSYVNRSKYLLLPLTDADTIAMSVLIPLLMTEVNFGMQFLANPIIYGIDIDMNDLQISPLSFWNVKADAATDTKPELNVLQPNMDIPNQAEWIKEQLAIWLETKNIRASQIASMGGENISSGIALIIREMDTTDDRKKQATYFTAFEADFWNRLAVINNKLADAGKLNNPKKFSSDFAVKTTFNPVATIEDKTQVYSRTVQAYQAGLISRERALKIIFPEWGEAEIQEELENGDFLPPVNSTETNNSIENEENVE